MKIRKIKVLKIIFVVFPLLWLYFNTDLLTAKANPRRHKIQHTLVPRSLISNFKYNLTNQDRLFDKKGVNGDVFCPNKIRRPDQKAENTWQPIHFLNEDVYIYSAFIEKSFVRIIGAVTPALRSKLKLYCYLWSSVNDGPIMTDASRLYISKGYDGRFVTTIFRCSLDVSEPIPDLVSLVTKQCDQPNSIIKITKQEYTQRQFTLCLSPLYSSYTRAHRLVEWIELNRLLGAEHFIIYNCDPPLYVDKVLKYYQNLRIVDVLQWCIPTTQSPKTSSKEFQVFGKIASNNDCLFRLRQGSKFIVLEDPDEIIVPHTQMTWNELLNFLPAARGDYNFRDVKFCDEGSDNVDILLSEKDVNVKHKISYILKTQRESNIYLFTEKSELIVDPNFVDLLDNHKVVKYRDYGGPYHVPPGIGFAHQYIPCGNKPADTHTTEDLTLVKYKGELLNAVSKVMDEIGDIGIGL